PDDRECRGDRARAERPPPARARTERERDPAARHPVGPAVKFLSAVAERLRDGLRRSQEFLGGRLDEVFASERPIDDALFEEVEELLIAADLGVLVAADFKHRAREAVMFGTVARAGELRPLFRRFVAETLAGAAQGLDLDHAPAVVLLLGVNGSGKT